ncbi:MAG TPA: hypothetical protein VGE55_04315 [Limnobacter sp.]|uniref:hypothetical protein n=1 Tax=Limnobacter sp. TaxID=2003368 RepID=UPI002ED81DEE
MNTYISSSAKNHQRILWVVSAFFYFTLVSFGSTLMQDLPTAYQQSQTPYAASSEQDRARLKELQGVQEKLDSQTAPINTHLKELQSQRDAQNSVYQNLKAQQRSLLESRTASQDAQYNDSIKTLNAEVAQALKDLQGLDEQIAKDKKSLSDLREGAAVQIQALNTLKGTMDEAEAKAKQAFDLRVFFIRLALIVPLVLAAAYVLKKHRKGTYWPFVYGFAAAAFTFFFVELTPYIPDFGFGKYVYSLCAIGLTVFAGVKTIQALNDYLARQRELEKTSSQARKAMLSKDTQYDASMKKLKAGTCPSCEKPIADFIKEHEGKPLHCPHCGFGIKTRCASCGEVKNSLTKFCAHCGSAESGLADDAA